MHATTASRDRCRAIAESTCRATPAMRCRRAASGRHRARDKLDTIVASRVGPETERHARSIGFAARRSAASHCAGLEIELDLVENISLGARCVTADIAAVQATRSAARRSRSGQRRRRDLRLRDGRLLRSTRGRGGVTPEMFDAVRT